jgi:hypothetical protein
MHISDRATRAGASHGERILIAVRVDTGWTFLMRLSHRRDGRHPRIQRCNRAAESIVSVVLIWTLSVDFSRYFALAEAMFPATFAGTKPLFDHCP